MADSISETVTTGYGKRLSNSISGIIIVLILFFSSFGVLFWNEGRAYISNFAKTAINVDSANASVNESLNGKLVSLYGDITTDGQIDDGLYTNPGNYLALERIAEMYAWEEKSDSSSKENLGGS